MLSRQELAKESYVRAGRQETRQQISRYIGQFVFDGSVRAQFPKESLHAGLGGAEFVFPGE